MPFPSRSRDVQKGTEHHWWRSVAWFETVVWKTTASCATTERGRLDVVGMFSQPSIAPALLAGSNTQIHTQCKTTQARGAGKDR